MSKKSKILIISSEILIFTILIFLIIFSIKTHSKRYFESIAETSLTKVLDINELHTLEYRYNSYTIVYATKYSIDVYDTYKDILESVLQDFHSFNKDQFFSFEDFRTFMLSSKEKDFLYSGFLNLCHMKEDFDDLKDFLNLSRKNALKMINTQKYAVAYEGIITAGINKPISFSIDRDEKIVTVIVPKAEIIDTNVYIPADTENKSVIYSEKKYINSDGWHKEAYRACRVDLQEKINADTEFLNLATENARDASLLDANVNKNQVTIRLPQAKALQTPNIIDDSINPYSSADGFIKTIITPEEKLMAQETANQNIIRQLNENTNLVQKAENRIKIILGNYIHQIGEFSGLEYKIIWEKM